MLDAVVNVWHNTSTLELVSVAFGLAYVILATKENKWCWPAAFVGTGSAIILFWDVNLVMESGLNVYYLAMAVYGWWQWQHGGTNNGELVVKNWRSKQHLGAISLIAILTLISGTLLNSNTDAALPYLDSFTTWSAVITTWMIAKKILENWLYWIVIDIASIYLYLERGLTVYAGLYLIYTIVAVFGYFAWRSSLRYAD